MTREQTIELICQIYSELAPSVDDSLSISESTRVFGGALDSVNVVSLIIELEQQIAEDYGVEITIADDLAMSQRQSPFRTVGSLADYVQGLMIQAQA